MFGWCAAPYQEGISIDAKGGSAKGSATGAGQSNEELKGRDGRRVGGSGEGGPESLAGINARWFHREVD